MKVHSMCKLDRQTGRSKNNLESGLRTLKLQKNWLCYIDDLSMLLILLLLLPPLLTSPQEEDKEGMMHSGGGILLRFESCVESIPKRMKTSEQVTNIDKRIRTMMIHVRPNIHNLPPSTSQPSLSLSHHASLHHHESELKNFVRGVKQVN